MTDTIEPGKQDERFAKILGNILVLSANESLVAAQMEVFSYFSPMPASLPLLSDGILESKLDKLSASMGGPPKLILVKDGDAPPHYDTYIEAAISESIDVFMRARASVCRTHLYMIGSSTLKNHPETMNLPEDQNIQPIIISQTEDLFWEHAETSFIRLASFWDRIGQILDFVFFNIRQYERDGFSAVLDRIYCNHLPMSTRLSSSDSWVRLRKFQTNEQPEGLKWLLRRRNLLIHSLHLHAGAGISSGNQIFSSAYNHLDEAIRNKLLQGSSENELKQLHLHLRTAALLLPDVIEVALIGSENRK